MNRVNKYILTPKKIAMQFGPQQMINSKKCHYYILLQPLLTTARLRQRPAAPPIDIFYNLLMDDRITSDHDFTKL